MQLVVVLGSDQIGTTSRRCSAAPSPECYRVGQAVCVMTASQAECADAARQIGWTVFTTEELKEETQKLLSLLAVKED
jgi:hypothetical protein